MQTYPTAVVVGRGGKHKLETVLCLGWLLLERMSSWFCPICRVLCHVEWSPMAVGTVTLMTSFGCQVECVWVLMASLSPHHSSSTAADPGTSWTIAGEGVSNCSSCASTPYPWLQKALESHVHQHLTCLVGFFHLASAIFLVLRHQL